LLVALSGGEGLARALLWRPIVWLGTISYSLYMAQGAVIWFAEAFLRAAVHLGHQPVPAGGRTLLAVPPEVGTPALVMTVAVILGVAHLSYVWIERPLRDWSRRAWTPAPAVPMASLEGAGDR
jgi:peptidoglycan/LPS O-acetylase OafA/YrhL